ncbi:5858_t:CDS:2, partial [Funneliformis geosporum]
SGTRIVNSYPLDSAITGIIMSYLVQDLEQEKNDLAKKVGELALKLGEYEAMRDKVRDYAQVLPTIIAEISELNHLSPEKKDTTAQSDLAKMKETITKLEK